MGGPESVHDASLAGLGGDGVAGVREAESKPSVAALGATKAKREMGRRVYPRLPVSLLARDRESILF